MVSFPSLLVVLLPVHPCCYRVSRIYTRQEYSSIPISATLHGSTFHQLTKDTANVHSFDVAPRSTIDKIQTEIYSVKNATIPNYGAVESQCLALLFIILAVGSLHNLELPPNDPSADEYLDLSKRSLSKSDLMTHSTLAGIQTLVGPHRSENARVLIVQHIMAHYHLYDRRCIPHFR